MNKPNKYILCMHCHYSPCTFSGHPNRKAGYNVMPYETLIWQWWWIAGWRMVRAFRASPPETSWAYIFRALSEALRKDHLADRARTIPTFCSFLEPPACSLNVSVFLNFSGNVLNFLIFSCNLHEQSPLCLGTSRFSNSARHMSKSSWKRWETSLDGKHPNPELEAVRMDYSCWTPTVIYDLTSQPNQELRDISLTNSLVMPFHVQCPSHWLGSPYVMCTGNTSIELNAMDMKRPPVRLLHIPRQWRRPI